MPWLGANIRAGTPRDVIGTLAQAVSRTVTVPEVRGRLIAAGLEVVESTPAEYAEFRKKDLAKWARMIKQGNIRSE
ncbi:MAG: tripartite tricarboxylate transporter substrate-binding protein [Burkholderiales bacterium]